MTMNAVLDMLSIDTLGLPTLTRNSLKYCGNIETIGELRRTTPQELRNLPMIGKKGLAAIADALKGLPPP